MKKQDYYAKGNLKILVLSDIHIYTKKDIVKVKNFVDKMKENNYDCIFVVGDIVDSISVLSREGIRSELSNLFKYFASIAHTYFVTGNHDEVNLEARKEKYKGINLDYLRTFFDGLSKIENVEFLNNRTLDIGDHFTVSGIRLDEAYYSLKDSKSNLDKGCLSFLRKLNKEKTNILLCHYPDVVVELFKKGYLENVDYCISGHNHNGMTQFKFLPIEAFLNLMGEKNRGIITPGKSLKLKDTAKLRGVRELDEKTKLIINPAFKSLSKQSRIEVLDWMFYKGYTEINFVGPRKSRK